MKTAFKLALGVLALSATVVAAQDGRRGDGVRDGNTAAGSSVTRPLPPGARPLPPVVRPQPLPPIARPRPRGPVVHFTPAPAFPIWSHSFGYSERYHDTCQRKAWRLRWFERRAAGDGYLSSSERIEISALRRDLRRTCGDFRWRG